MDIDQIVIPHEFVGRVVFDPLTGGRAGSTEDNQYVLWKNDDGSIDLSRLMTAEKFKVFCQETGYEG